MILANVTHISLLGKYSPYQEEFWPTFVNIKDLIAGRVSFGDKVSSEEKYLKSFEYEIYAHDEEWEDREKVGSILGRLLYFELFDLKGIDLRKVFNEIDQFPFEAYYLGTGHQTGISGKNIFVLDSIVIYPEYRNKKIGSASICLLPEVMETQFNFKLGCFIVQPEPEYDYEREFKPDNSQYSALKCRCQNFWMKLGFKPLDDTDYWYLNAEKKIMICNGETDKGSLDCAKQRTAQSAKVYEFPNRKD